MTATPSIPPATLASLIQEGESAFTEFRTIAKDRHNLFIPCDHHEIYGVLQDLRSRAATFLELGSGAGVVTIMTDLLGFEAYGIELEPWLVERSMALAEQFHSGATFAEGTFVPLEHQEEVELLSADFHAPCTGACAYDELELELADFDLVFAYPWPGDEYWLADMVRRYARPDTLLLTYDVREGYVVNEAGAPPR